jgi:hypothetical protein
MSSFPKAMRESLPVSEASQHLALCTNVLEGRFCELRLHLILGSWAEVSRARKPAPALVVLGGGGSFAGQAPYLLDDGRGGRYLVQHSIGSRLQDLLEVPWP